MINQLRLYRIDPALKQVFLDRFRDHAARIMRDRYGFTILAMWLSDDEPQPRFTYLLSWPDRATMREAWRRFMADEEWSAVKQRSREGRGEAVQAVEDIVLDAVAFSAPLG